MFRSKIFYTLLILGLGIAVIQIPQVFSQSGSTAPTIDPKFSRMKGDINAPIKIVEFIDFQCPMCAKGAMYLNKKMKDDSGMIFLEMKYFPLKSHKHSLLASQYTECAAQQGKFWKLHDFILENQNTWKTLADAKPVFDLYVKEAKIDQKKFKACLDDPAVIELIESQKEEGQQLKVRSTPTYFVNGKLVVGTTALKQELLILEKKMAMDEE